MQLAGYHSHLNGLEFLQVQKPRAWGEIRDTIETLDANKLKKKRGYSPKAINVALVSSFQQHQWGESRGDEHIHSDTNHLFKDRIGVALQFGASGFGPYDIFAKHMALYVGDVIDVGIAILPMKQLQAQMSSGVACYEGELYNLIREGRAVPAVPLVLIGLAPSHPQNISAKEELGIAPRSRQS
jgi:hypothetical protein